MNYENRHHSPVVPWIVVSIDFGPIVLHGALSVPQCLVSPFAGLVPPEIRVWVEDALETHTIYIGRELWRRENIHGGRMLFWLVLQRQSCNWRHQSLLLRSNMGSGAVPR